MIVHKETISISRDDQNFDFFTEYLKKSFDWKLVGEDTSNLIFQRESYLVSLPTGKIQEVILSGKDL